MTNSKQHTNPKELVESTAQVVSENPNQMEELCRLMREMNENNVKMLENIRHELNQAQNRRIYFTKDLCKMYEVSEGTIYNYRKSGKLDYCSDGQKVWFTAEQLDDFDRRHDSRYNSKLRKVQ
ncbi:MAG: helix-turn-helix domain-containing protein [Bacteroidales bacterium]